MKGEALALRGLEKRYKETLAVSDVSVDVDAGEFVSVLGPSGSGKTTLLMMIAGFETPTAGEIVIGPRNVTHVAPNRRDIGMVFQKYALFPHMSVAQNVGFPLKMRGVAKSEIARRVRGALELVRLSGYEDRLPHQLSGGQQQRVAVARALIFEPPVLLMDEPLGALDKKLRENMQIEIKSLQRRLGVTVIYVTHDQEEALTMSDRIAVMSNGHLVQIGSPMELYQKPASPFVADFIGKMNFIDGEYLGSDGASSVIQFSEQAKLAAPSDLNGSSGLLSFGMPVRIAVRPERLRLAPSGHGGREAIPARVETAIFVGSFYIFLVSISGREDQIVQVQAPANGVTLPFASGDQVDLIADLESIRVFPAGEAQVS